MPVALSPETLGVVYCTVLFQTVSPTITPLNPATNDCTTSGENTTDAPNGLRYCMFR